ESNAYAFGCHFKTAQGRHAEQNATKRLALIERYKVFGIYLGVAHIPLSREAEQIIDDAFGDGREIKAAAVIDRAVLFIIARRARAGAGRAEILAPEQKFDRMEARRYIGFIAHLVTVT